MSEKQAFITKLVEVSKAIGFLEFDKSNTGQGYKYVSAASVIRKLNVELAKHGLLAYVSHEDVTTSEFTNTKGNKSLMAVVTCRVTFTDGEHAVTCFGSGSGMDSGDKAVMKASTAAYKYAIAHGLTLGWDAVDPEDDSNEAPRSAGQASAGKPPSSPAKGKRAQAKAQAQEDLQSAVQSLLERIAKATSNADLDALKGEILAVKAKDEAAFGQLKEATIARRGELG